jgi:hypothetical protein
MQIVEVQVIPWQAGENRWAIAIRYSNGLKQVFEVGDRPHAEREREELQRHAITPSSPPASSAPPAPRCPGR